MKRALAFAAIALPLTIALLASAQESSLTHKGRVIVPESGMERPEDVGVRMHTMYQIFVPSELASHGAAPGSYAFPEITPPPPAGPPLSGYAFETPSSIACLYGLVTAVTGCNPNTFKTVPGGGSKAIAIVDAYSYPTAMADLNKFSAQFGLPALTTSTFKVLYASTGGGCTGTEPANNSGWETEQALDIEWSHAMAPQAKIYLVEAASDLISDLLNAEDCASKTVAAAGGGEVSNSWGGSEFSGETSYDSHFVKSTVVFLAGTGDTAGTAWPGVSPNAVTVGGTTTSRINAGSTFGNFAGEVAWESGGGGTSQYEARPSYQSALTTGAHRLVPDVAADSNPNTGVWVYDNTVWYIVGGTSVATPIWAGIVNHAGHFAASSNAELTTVYNAYGTVTTYAADYNDISDGRCGAYDGYIAAVKWDPCTGVGSPKGLGGK